MDSLAGGDASARDEELELGATSAQAHMKVRIKLFLRWSRLC